MAALGYRDRSPIGGQTVDEKAANLLKCTNTNLLLVDRDPVGRVEPPVVLDVVHSVL